jgi:hypothetical protein
MNEAISYLSHSNSWQLCVCAFNIHFQFINPIAR